MFKNLIKKVLAIKDTDKKLETVLRRDHLSLNFMTSEEALEVARRRRKNLIKINIKIS